jgi:hypothetical protein
MPSNHTELVETSPQAAGNGRETGITARRVPRWQAGGCSFCTRRHNMVWVLRGTLRVEARICQRCLDELKQITK